eukprot:4597924-Pleurochrysis_carterae.AAC.1
MEDHSELAGVKLQFRCDMQHATHHVVARDETAHFRYWDIHILFTYSFCHQYYVYMTHLKASSLLASMMGRCYDARV